MKEQFILNEIWTLTFGAAFQRASVYEGETDEAQKELLKIEIRRYIESELEPQYVNGDVTEEQHIKNIYLLSNHTKKFAVILNGGKLNFGVSQKLLNLHLKYLWCLDKTATPLHFPVDRRIQETLGLKPIKPWTEFQNEIDYMRIIDSVKQRLDKDIKTVAEYELNHFKRRVKTTK
ncbi:MAG: hypothetical protein ABI685_08430 [Ferruginibacter sp.]